MLDCLLQIVPIVPRDVKLSHQLPIHAMCIDAVYRPYVAWILYDSYNSRVQMNWTPYKAQFTVVSISTHCMAGRVPPSASQQCVAGHGVHVHIS